MKNLKLISRLFLLSLLVLFTCNTSFGQIDQKHLIIKPQLQNLPTIDINLFQDEYIIEDLILHSKQLELDKLNQKMEKLKLQINQLNDVIAKKKPRPRPLPPCHPNPINDCPKLLSKIIQLQNSQYTTTIIDSNTRKVLSIGKISNLSSNVNKNYKRLDLGVKHIDMKQPISLVIKNKITNEVNTLSITH